MNPRIPESLIQRVIDSIDLVELMTPYLKRLRRSGVQWEALCPFHAENTPSLKIHPEKRLWRCHGCQAGGNAIGFLQLAEHLSFPAAVKSLAERAGMAIVAAEDASGYRAMLVAEATWFWSEVHRRYDARCALRWRSARQVLELRADDDWNAIGLQVRMTRSAQRWERILARLDATAPAILYARYLRIRAVHPRVVLAYREERDLAKEIARVLSQSAVLVGGLTGPRFTELLDVVATRVS